MFVTKNTLFVNNSSWDTTMSHRQPKHMICYCLWVTDVSTLLNLSWI